MQTTKTVKTRDAAATILRKLGINSRDYNLFIDKTSAGHIVNVRAAVEHLEALAKPKAEPKAKPKAEPKAKAKAEGKLNLPGRPVTHKPETDESISNYCRRLIKLGYTNNEIFMATQEHFGAPASHRYYPSWYRWDLRRQEAKANSGK